MVTAFQFPYMSAKEVTQNFLLNF